MSASALASPVDPTEAARAVEAAALLVSLAIQDTLQPVEDLACALERMRERAPAHDCLAHDLAVCVESLQFHDRLLQQLAFARDLLATALTRQPPDVASYGAPRWNALLGAVRGWVPGDSAIELSGLPSPPAAGGVRGTCELFD